MGLDIKVFKFPGKDDVFEVDCCNRLIGWIGDVGNGWDIKPNVNNLALQLNDGMWQDNSFSTKEDAIKELIKLRQ